VTVSHRCIRGLVGSVVLLAACGLLAQGKSSAELWQARIQGPDEYEVKQLAVTSDGTTWALVRSTSKGQFDALATQELRSFNARGGESGTIPLETLFGDQNVDLRVATPVMIAGEGSALFLFAVSRGRQVIGVRFEGKKGRTLVRGLSAAAKDRYLSGAFAANNGMILLVGRVEERQWRLKVSAALERVWEKDEPQDGAGTDALLAAAVQPDGRFAAVGARFLRNGPASLFIVSCSVDGQIVRKKELAGRIARIALDGGGYIVVHDAPGANGGDVWLRAMAANLDERWTRRIATDLVTPFIFEIGSGPRGGWAVAGEQGRQVMVLFGGAEGPAESYLAPLVSRFWQRIWSVCPPVWTPDGVIIAATLRAVGAEGKPRQIGQLMKLKG
jgi:hypothetical protein